MFEFRSPQGSQFPHLTMGAKSYMMQGIFETYEENSHLLIGRYCSLAHDLKFLFAMNHDYSRVTTYPMTALTNPAPPPRKNRDYPVNTKQIIIGNDVWIGRGVTIMSGVRVGNGAVIGAGTIVTKNIPPYAIVIGNPPRILKYRFDSETIRKLQAIKWWNWNPEKIVREFCETDDPQDIVEKFYSPDLEIVPKDSLGDHIRSLKSRGFRIFSTIADFQARIPLWKKILEEFLASNLQNSILVIHLRREVTRSQMEEIRAAAGDPTDGKLIFAVKSRDNRPFSLDSLRETEVFVTTREDDCSQAIDALSDLDLKTRYIFDDLVFY